MATNLFILKTVCVGTCLRACQSQVASPAALHACEVPCMPHALLPSAAASSADTAQTSGRPGQQLLA